jgi:HK97 family phage prohead protease
MLAPSTYPTLADVFAPATRIAADGTVAGYASVFGEIDAARDVVLKGAFADSLKLRGPRRVPMLFQHDPAEPIGIWLELREDSHGLYARGRLIPEVARARELLSLLRAGAADGLSIGFRAARAHRPEDAGAQSRRRRSLGNLDRHLPAARGRARHRGEGGVPSASLTGTDARRAGVGGGGGRRRGRG